MISLQFKVNGMSCSSCVRHVEQALKSVHGVTAVTVVLETELAQVTYDPSQTSVEQMIDAVNDEGYELILANDDG
jgi:P-type Cu+ transporter